MTFSEAIELKGKLPYKIETDNADVYGFLFVTPEKSSDIEPYINEVARIWEDLTDEFSIQFSSNGEFSLNYLYNDFEGHIIISPAV